MTQTQTEQMKKWSSDFGKQYTDRNPQTFEDMERLYDQNFGVKRSALNLEFLGDLDKSISILEVGSNVGTQLQGLQKMGFKNLYGIELQSYAVEIAKKQTQGVNIIQGSAFDIPFKDGFFDLVFTSGVLIHISPDDIERALREIRRCSKHYIFGFEYFKENYENIHYRGNENLMWKGNFKKMYQTLFPELRVLKQKLVPYVGSENKDEMFLLDIATSK